MNMTTIKTRVVHNIDFAAKWYQFANWAEPSIKQVSKAANRKDQKYHSLSIRLFFLAGCEKEATGKEKPDTTVFIVVFHLLIA